MKTISRSSDIPLWRESSNMTDFDTITTVMRRYLVFLHYACLGTRRKAIRNFYASPTSSVFVGIYPTGMSPFPKRKGSNSTTESGSSWTAFQERLVLYLTSKKFMDLCATSLLSTPRAVPVSHHYQISSPLLWVTSSHVDMPLNQ